ncbi:MAG: hypothetical protein LBF66_01020 [Holosporales bacterium]|nr:hypothetical protein [Holosporales bacterium]
MGVKYKVSATDINLYTAVLDAKKRPSLFDVGLVFNVDLSSASERSFRCKEETSKILDVLRNHISNATSNPDLKGMMVAVDVVDSSDKEIGTLYLMSTQLYDALGKLKDAIKKELWMIKLSDFYLEFPDVELGVLGDAFYKYAFHIILM